MVSEIHNAWLREATKNYPSSHGHQWLTKEKSGERIGLPGLHGCTFSGHDRPRT
uniref:Uncharacterized protein n=1 Tax=Arthrobacter sp. J3.37 TaxID=347208 RepID=I3W0U2_9MICC|nr:hypothetical protein [Arthrobacter sp. J3.37]